MIPSLVNNALNLIPSKYKIKRLEDSEIKPEETLADSLSEHAVVELPIGPEVFRVLYLILGILTVFLLVKAFHLQIIKGGRFAQIAERSRAVTYSTPALRGIVYDTKGRPLVENLPLFDLVAIQSGLPDSRQEFERIATALSPVIGIATADLIRTFDDNRKVAIFVLKKNLSKEQAVRLKVLALPGLNVVANFQRRYLGDFAFSNILGYTAKVGPDDLARDPYYLLTDRAGRLGLEAYYEKILRGSHQPLTPGGSGTNENQSRPGHDLILNIDKDIQTRLYRTMVNVLSPAGLKRGAAIIQDPKTGAVLGLVSLPSFDSNIFENYFDPESAAEIAKTLKDRNKPLFNRAIGGRYSPGSTIKPLLAMAGLKEKVVTPETTVYANGSISVKSKYDPDVIYTFNDWKIHGLTDLKKAIADSVDVYFYALGGGYGEIAGLGGERIAKYLKELWADRALNIDLPGEVDGFVPTEEWKKSAKGEDWFIGDTYNISIGQGDLTVAPLWLNAYIGAIANGGDLMRPYVVRVVKDPVGSVVSQQQPEVLTKLPFDAATIGFVREGMRQTVLSGTAVLLRDLPLPVAAKTGTVQTAGRGLNSLFVAFGPYENPEIVMTVLVENTKGQSLAMRIAYDFLSWYFSLIGKGQ